MKDKHLIDVFIQNGQENDDCLHRSGFNVDTILFRENKTFKNIICQTIDYMKSVLCTSFKDYGKLKGISGANIGIPLNIVAVLHNGHIKVFINPNIIETSHSKITVLSNCGSLNLPKPISVERHTWIRVKWMDITGKHHEEHFTAHNNNRTISNIACTLQHEIDHNKGILITDLRR